MKFWRFFFLLVIFGAALFAGAWFLNIQSISDQPYDASRIAWAVFICAGIGAFIVMILELLSWIGSQSASSSVDETEPTKVSHAVQSRAYEIVTRLRRKEAPRREDAIWLLELYLNNNFLPPMMDMNPRETLTLMWAYAQGPIGAGRVGGVMNFIQGYLSVPSVIDQIVHESKLRDNYVAFIKMLYSKKAWLRGIEEELWLELEQLLISLGLSRDERQRVRVHVFGEPSRRSETPRNDGPPKAEAPPRQETPPEGKTSQGEDAAAEPSDDSEPIIDADFEEVD